MANPVYASVADNEIGNGPNMLVEREETYEMIDATATVCINAASRFLGNASKEGIRIGLPVPGQAEILEPAIDAITTSSAGVSKWGFMRVVKWVLGA